MADDNSTKVTIELDLDDLLLQQKTKKVKSGFEQLQDTISGAFSKSMFGVISFNQALEIGEKLIQGYEMALAKMKFAEDFNNQAVAFKNLAAQIGVNGNVLLDTIKKASHGTLTDLEAIQTGFKLLNSGIKADAIPALVQYATTLEKTRQIPFAQSIQAFSSAIESGTTRGLREFGIQTEKSGSRLKILSTILAQAEIESKNFGDGYSETAKKVETRSKQFSDTFSKNIGDAFTGIGVALFGDEIDKTNLKIKHTEESLDRLESAVKRGDTAFKVSIDGFRQMVPIDQARLVLQKELNEEKSKNNLLTQEETEKTKDQTKELENFGTIKKSFSLEERNLIDLSAKRIGAEQEVARREKEDGQASIKSLQALAAAKKASLDKDIDDRKAEESTKLQSQKQLTEKLISLEHERVIRTRAIRVDDDQFSKSLDQAQLTYFEKNMRETEGAQQKHQDVLLKMEDQRYQKETERLRMSGLPVDQFNRQLEAKEAEHQRKMNAIKQQYSALTIKNMQFGISTSLKQLEAEYGSFSKFTEKATQKTHGIMTNAFVEAAKGHGNAMELMKAQFLEMIGTQLIESGTFHILAGLWPPNPLELGQGAAMIAAGSALVGASAGAPSAIGGGGGGDVGGTYGNVGGPSGALPLAQNQDMQKKQAQIIINGDFLNSRETANHLADILRTNSDITDYAIVAQGKNYA